MAPINRGTLWITLVAAAGYCRKREEEVGGISKSEIPVEFFRGNILLAKHALQIYGKFCSGALCQQKGQEKAHKT
jgi:hypothetical protein